LISGVLELAVLRVSDPNPARARRFLLDSSKQAVRLLRKRNLGRSGEQSAKESSFGEHGEE
jgi:hypothetical protein